MIKVWLDDVRPAPEGYHHVKTYREAMDFIDNNEVNWISLDHDLGDYDDMGREWTGYDVLMRLVEMKLCGAFNGLVFVHSANIVAVQRMEDVIKQYGFNE